MNPTRLLIPSAAALLAAACGDGGDPERELVRRAQGIHERVITLDTHADIDAGDFTLERNYTQDLDTQVTLPKMEAGGLDVVWFIVYTAQGPLSEEGYAAAYANAIDKFDAIHRLAEEIAPERIELAYTSEDVRRIAAAGRKAAMIGIENAYPVGLALSRIGEFHARGGRYMSLSHNGHSQFSDSHTGEEGGEYLHGGLSEEGRLAVAEMNRLGIMIDISHPSKESIMQTLELSRAPVIASHSAARALTGHSRNLDDQALLALKENGGVVQTVALDTYISEERRRFLAEGRADLTRRVAAELGHELPEPGRAARMGAAERAAHEAAMEEVDAVVRERLEEEVAALAPAATVSDLVDHIDYMAGLIGIEHVGISSDFDGGGGIEGWSDASETFNVTLELARRGYTEEEIAMLWSGNLLRVLDEVQRTAAAIQSEY